MTKGHTAFSTSRVEKLSLRANFSKYLFMPTMFGFRKVVRVTAVMLKHLKTRNLDVGKFFDRKNKFQMFHSMQNMDEVVVEETKLTDYFAGSSSINGMKATTDAVFFISDEDISHALEYWYKKGTAEVKQFNKPELLSKIAIEKNGVLFSRSRIMAGQRFVVAGGFGKNSLGLEVGMNLMTPVLDRWSPISYSIANFCAS